MRSPPTVRAWLTPEELTVWIRRAQDKETYQRRLAVALVANERRHVPEVARLLCVSVRSVWSWLTRYNGGGPTALEVQRRGGRRDGHLPRDAEAALLAEFHDAALRGEILTAGMLQPAVEQAVGRAVSTKYVRDLLRRHDWRKMTPRPHHPKAEPAVQDAYKKNSRAACEPH